MTGIVIAYHDKYLTRLANIYLDQYDLHGHAGATKWYQRITSQDPKLSYRLNDKIKEIAPLRGKTTT